jgi:hypothetical protein
MTEQKTTSGLDFETLRHAFEQLDADLVASFYADEAEVRLINRDTPPSSPYVLCGKEDIVEFLRNAFGRDMKLHVEWEVIGEDRIAFNEAMEYPDGTHVLCSTMLDVRDGKIVREESVQAWDE